MDRASTRQRNARRGVVRSSRNRFTARRRLRPLRGEARMLQGLGRSVFGFPNTMTTRLKYSTFINLIGGIGTVAGNLYAANGIFDPDISGVGHQPMYRDVYAAIYDQYTVLGSKITVSFAATSALPCHVGIGTDDDATTSANLETLMEQSNNVHALTGAPGAEVTTLSATYSPLKNIGVAVKDDGSSATAQGSNPAELWVYKVWAISSDIGVATAVAIQVDIEYTVKFTELSTQIQN